ncbi:hypothetical protein MTO96_008586 [Rhipicephalus appendiculatus]
MGKVMKIGCLQPGKTPDLDLCSLHSYLFDMLETKNVSLVYQSTSNFSMTLDDLYCENTDMAVLRMPLDEHVLAVATYGEVQMVSETFYALASETQAPSLYHTTLQSVFTIAVTAASLAICAGLLVLIGDSHLHERVQSETLFLLAHLLARSTPFPCKARWPRVQNVVYLFWALAMLPLSQYIQGELTSLVTVGRPANSLDTLKELEAALDAGAMAPCVRMESVSFNNLMYSYHSTTLGKKLQESLSEHPPPVVKGQHALLPRLRHENRWCVLRTPHAVVHAEEILGPHYPVRRGLRDTT